MERRRQRVWKEWMAKLANIMALRFRGIDPDRLLARLDPWFGWLFSPTAMVGVLAFAACSLLLVLVNFDTFRAKLPEFNQFFAAGNWFYLRSPWRSRRSSMNSATAFPASISAANAMRWA